jgi:pimeloyl-ACP methyl ester carboxylesterase
MKRILIFVLISMISSGCFRNWINTESEIEAHYALKSFKPKYDVIENDSSKLFIASFGKNTNPPILFIHGAPGSWDGYFRQLDDSVLREKFHLISVDRPGYERSKTKLKNEALEIEFQAKMIVKALSINHSGQKAIVLGRSYGAPIAAKMALLFPDKIKKVIMVSPAIDPKEEKFWWFSKFGKLGIVRFFLPSRMNQATDEKFKHKAELEKMESDWEKLELPITTFFAGNDNIISAKNFDFAKEKLSKNPANKFILIQNSGHLITVYAADTIRAELMK